MDYVTLIIILVGVLVICLIVIAARSAAQHTKLKRYEKEEKERANRPISHEAPRTTGSFCPHCGSTISADANFCKTCGQKLG